MSNNTNNGTLFVLGAPDHEMEAIKTLLTLLKLDFIEGKVFDPKTEKYRNPNPSEAYQLGEACTRQPFYGTLVLVESDFDSSVWNTSDWTQFQPSEVIRVDHHKPGDKGFDMGPDKFWEGSSIGQVADLIGKRWPSALFIHQNEKCSNCMDAHEPFVLRNNGKVSCYACGWDVRTVGLPDLWYVAAADHCLAAAYQGKCDMVRPELMLAYRAEQKAKFLGKSPEDILEDMNKAIKVLEEASQDMPCNMGCDGPYRPTVHSCACGVGCYTFWFGNQQVVDLTRASVPELPEAACYTGKVYITAVEEKHTGRKKVVLGGEATEATVKHFMEFFAPSFGLTDIYGVPKRGFAGGYLK